MKKIFLPVFLLIIFHFAGGVNHSFFSLPDNSFGTEQFAAGFSGGSGTLNDPFRVTTAAQLNEVRHFPSSYFKQMADIDLGISPWNEGVGWIPVGGHGSSFFTGVFDGNGYKILNLTIRMPDSCYVGLFGKVMDAGLKNINLVNVSVVGKQYTGALAGAVYGGALYEVEVSGSVTGKGEYTGGLFGLVSGTSVMKSSSAALVTGHRYTGGLAGSGMADGCKATGKITGLPAGEEESISTGGMLGEGSAVNCYSSGEVTGGSQVGGLIGTGWAQGCHATGNVTAAGDYAGGLIGQLVLDQSSGEEEYVTGSVAKGDTAVIVKNVVTVSGQPVEILLEDGTRLKLPAFTVPMGISLGRAPFDMNPVAVFPPGSEYRSTGSMRTLTIKGAGEVPLVKPVITIPASEAGTVNPETVNAVRVGNLMVNGKLVEDYSAVLPVFLDEQGNYKFTDALFPDGIVADSSKSAQTLKSGVTMVPGEERVSEMKWVGNVRYFLMTFDKSLNWSKRPVLERMVPDSTLSEDGFRKPWRRVSPAKREKIARQPVCNVIILVHGHNEEEKDGFSEARTLTPWEFTYKRMVWDLLYESISKNREKDLPSGCTATYEFIFPTYRPIFSPVSDKSGFTLKTLGEDLGKLINEEMENNPQLKAMLDQDMPFNLFLVAHSQGGLVARAGLRFIKPEILKRLKLVVTWGSPHTGAGLYSLRYALAVGHDMVIDGYRFPLQNIGQSEAYQSGVSGIALDAPGIRDIRWDASKKDMLRLGELFRENTATLNEFPDTELPYGRMFYSDNLKIFNQEEGSFMGDLLYGKFKFYEGTTTHIAPLELGWDLWSLKKLYYFGANATGIEKGAQLNKLVMKENWNASDGAVPTYSQRGEGIWSSGDIRKRSIESVDHEEFYGAEYPQRNGYTILKGKEVVGYTFTDMELASEPKSCPKLDPDLSEKNDSIFIEGKLLFPIYGKSYGGDDQPGKRILKMEAHRDHPDSTLIPALAFKFKDDGTFEGKGKKAEIPDDTIIVSLTLKDGSQVSAEAKRKIENKVYNETKKLWYTAIQKAVDEAASGDVLTVYPGIYKEYVGISQKHITLRSAKGPEVTILEGEGKGGSGVRAINCNLVLSGLTLRKYDYGVYLWNTSTGTVYSPVITNNRVIGNDNKGIYLTGTCLAVISDNVIDNNRYYGIDFDKYTFKKGTEPVRIENNYISGANRGIRIDGEAWVSSSGNTIRNNEWGIEILGSSSVQVARDTIEYNTADGVRIYLAQNPVSVTNCVIRNNTYSGIASTTNLGSHVVSNNTLSGNGVGISFTHYSTGNCSVEIRNNQITGNKKGINIGVSGCTISGNTISGNTEEGGISVTSSTGEISGNEITGNISGMGGGIYVHSGNVTIKKNTISQNKANIGGGIMLQSNVDLLIQENAISKNQASEYGGGIYINTAGAVLPRVTGNTLSENFATKKGGGIYGRASGWPSTEVVTVSGKPTTVSRYVPCFTETTNTYSGNSHGEKFGAWGPGVDKWCEDSGFDVHP